MQRFVLLALREQQKQTGVETEKPTVPHTSAPRRHLRLPQPIRRPPGDLPDRGQAGYPPPRGRVRGRPPPVQAGRPAQLHPRPQDRPGTGLNLFWKSSPSSADCALSKHTIYRSRMPRVRVCVTSPPPPVSQVAAACLYVVCRQDSRPYMLIDFSDVLQARRHRVFSSDITPCLIVLVHDFPQICVMFPPAGERLHTWGRLPPAVPNPAPRAARDDAGKRGCFGSTPSSRPAPPPLLSCCCDTH